MRPVCPLPPTHTLCPYTHTHKIRGRGGGGMQAEAEGWRAPGQPEPHSEPVSISMSLSVSMLRIFTVHTCPPHHNHTLLMYRRHGCTSVGRPKGGIGHLAYETNKVSHWPKAHQSRQGWLATKTQGVPVSVPLGLQTYITSSSFSHFIMIACVCCGRVEVRRQLSRQLSP